MERGGNLVLLWWWYSGLLGAKDNLVSSTSCIYRTIYSPCNCCWALKRVLSLET